MGVASGTAVPGMADFTGFFNGGRGKEGVCVWFFDGEIVVKCVVNVVLKRHFLGDEKYATFSTLFLRHSQIGKEI